MVIPQEVSYLNQRFYRVDIPFPVGGTLITSNGLYGKWRITAHLDGADDALRRGRPDRHHRVSEPGRRDGPIADGRPASCGYSGLMGE